MPKRICPRGLAALLALALATPNALAETGNAFPRIGGEVSIEIQNDFAFRSDDPDSEINDLFTTTEPTIRLEFSPELAIRAGLVLEPVADPEPGEDRVFADHGLFVEVLTIDYEAGDVALHAGKFAANFGIAWDAAPGIFGTDMAEDYEMSERLGVGGSVMLGNERIGRLDLSASVFFLDTSFLADSYPRGRGNTSRSDGGPSNTETLASYALALDGDLAAAAGLAYHLGFIDQARGEGGARRERGFAGALQYQTEIADGVTLAPLAEFVRFGNLGNESGVNRTYLTLAAEIGWGAWKAVAAYTGRFADTPAAGDDRDFQTQLSLGYEFDSGLAVELGWKRAREARVDTDTLGLLLSYEFAF